MGHGALFLEIKTWALSGGQKCEDADPKLNLQKFGLGGPLAGWVARWAAHWLGRYQICLRYPVKPILNGIF